MMLQMVTTMLIAKGFGFGAAADVMIISAALYDYWNKE